MRRWIAPVLRTLTARSHLITRPTRLTAATRPARLALTEMERRDLLTTVGFLGSATLVEDSTPSAYICVYVSPRPSSPTDPLVITFDYATANGTALAGSDYTAASGSVTLNAGNSWGAILTLPPILNDAIPEPTETFTVQFTNVTGATPANTSVTYTILDTDPKIPTTTTPSVDPGPAVIEGQVFELEAAVTASVGNPPGAVTFTATNTATLAVYTLGSGTLGTDLHPGEDDDLWEAELLQTSSLPVGTYTLTATYPGTDLYDGSSGSVTLTVAAAPVAPTAPASCDTPVVADPGGGTATAARTAGGILPGSGAAQLTQTALKSSGAGLPRAETVSWSNASGAFNTLAGNGTTSTWQPRLVSLNGEKVVGLAAGGADTLLFDLYDGTYHSRWGGGVRLVRNPGTGRYTLTDAGGNTFTFYDFSPSTPTGRSGRAIWMADRAGTVTEVVSWTADGKPAEVQTTTGSGGSAQTEAYVYSYYSGGAADGLLASVTQRRRTGSGAWATVGSVAYTYHDGTTAAGRGGDLRTVAVSDAVGLTDTTYYRYYTASGSGGGSGAVSLVKFAFGPAAYARLTSALGTGVDALADAQVDDYADNFFAYDAQDRVVTAVIAGTGCSVCSGGFGTYTYSYAANPSLSGAAGPNAWVVKTTETRPDGTVAAYYTNVAGQTMLTAVTTGGLTWVTYSRYDAAGRLVLAASPSAVSGYDDAYGDLVRYTSGNAQYLRDDEGLLTAYTYGSATTATTTTAGDVVGYQKGADLLRGETGDLGNGRLVPQSVRTYLSTPAGTYVPATSTAYRNADGTEAQTTTASYTWYGSTAQPASVTLTRPVVSTTQNGSGAATTTTTVFDALGRPVWTRDEAGFLTYTAYDLATGAVVKTIVDVNTSSAGDFTGLPSGWSTPTGGGLHLVTSYELDAKGRVTKATYPGGRADYTIYDDVAHEVRYYPAWNASTNAPTGPTTVTRDDRARGYTETLTMSAVPAVSSGRPTGTEAISGVLTLSRNHVNAAGQVVSTDRYFDLTGLTYTTSISLGTAGTNFYRTGLAYDSAGRPNKVVSPQGTVTRTEYDGRGRVVSEWVGTDDTPATGFWSPANLTGTNMVKVRELEYDGGGIGNGNLTKTTEYPGLSAPARVSLTWYDWRNRAVATKGGVETTESSVVQRPLIYVDFDNLDHVVQARRYVADGVTLTDANVDGVPDAPAAGYLRAQAATEYDDLGRVYRVKTYSVNPSTGAVSTNSLRTDTWYDSRGLVIKTVEPGGLATKKVYDGAGRSLAVFMTDGGGDTGYADVDDLTGDTVLEQTEATYDAAGRVIRVSTRHRHHDETGTGSLTGLAARVYHLGYYYDLADRLVATVDIGTSPGTVYAWPSTPPASTASVLVSTTNHDAAGRVYETTDPLGRVTRTTYDALGRVTKTVENYVDGVVSDGDDKTTEYTYNAAGRTSLTARLTGGGSQTTQWVYGVTTAGGSGVNSNDVVGATRWPDATTGAASGSEQEMVTVNALGQPVVSTDRNGTARTLTYDILGRLTVDTVTTLGSGVDGTVRRIETAYSGQGQAYKVTSYNSASGGSVVNQVLQDFNGLGQLIAEWQAHGGAVSFSTTPKLQHTYSFSVTGTANHSRLTSITYPSGYVLSYTYGSGVDTAISRLSSVGDTSAIEEYEYLGIGTVVVSSRPQPGIDLTYANRPGEPDGDAGDQYGGLDRFGQVVDQRWQIASSGAATDRVQYGYDRSGNRLYRDNLMSAVFGEVYTYDGLDRLVSFDRGALNGTKTGVSGSPSRSQDWNYDAVGNWDGIDVDGVAQARTANAQNEVTSVGGATTPGYDANGNMTQAETGLRYVYDAWNRLAAVKDMTGTTVLEAFAHDGLNRRIAASAGGTTTDRYYSDEWQVLEERNGASTKVRYVWSSAYTDALILRDRDTNADGAMDERLWVQQDANWNVTAIVDSNGLVVERYACDPFGQASTLTPGYGSRASTAYEWSYLHQGGQRDAITGNYYFRNRDYSPTLGRWTALDPIRYVAGDPNLYAANYNSPANRVDPLGLWGPFTRPGMEPDHILRWGRRDHETDGRIEYIMRELGSLWGRPPFDNPCNACEQLKSWIQLLPRSIASRMRGDIESIYTLHIPRFREGFEGGEAGLRTALNHMMRTWNEMILLTRLGMLHVEHCGGRPGDVQQWFAVLLNQWSERDGGFLQLQAEWLTARRAINDTATQAYLALPLPPSGGGGASMTPSTGGVSAEEQRRREVEALQFEFFLRRPHPLYNRDGSIRIVWGENELSEKGPSGYPGRRPSAPARR